MIMATKAKRKANSLSGFAISKHPAIAFSSIMKMSGAERTRKWKALSESSTSRFQKVAKQQIAELDSIEIEST
jgi:hypothetical protein